MAESDAPESQSDEVAASENRSAASSGPDDVSAEDESRSLQGVRTEAAFFAGPLPPPEIFRQYESILSGSADRILTMAEQQSRHRQDLESRALDSNAYTAKWGQRFAFVLGVSGIIGAVVLVALGRTWPGMVIFFADFFGLAGLFLWAEAQGRKELRRKARQSAGAEEETTAEQQELPLEGGGGLGSAD